MDNSFNYILKQLRVAFAPSPFAKTTFVGARNIPHGSPGKRTHYFFSHKSNGLIQLESYLELANALKVEAHPLTLEFRTQAFKMLKSSGQYVFPDFVVKLTNGQYEVHSVKPYPYDATSESLSEFLELREILAKLDIEYKHVSARVLPDRQQLARLLQLYQRGHRRCWTPREVDLAVHSLQVTPQFSMMDAYTIIHSVNLPCEILDYLIFHQLIHFEIKGEAHGFY